MPMTKKFCAYLGTSEDKEYLGCANSIEEILKNHLPKNHTPFIRLWIENDFLYVGFGSWSTYLLVKAKRVEDLINYINK